MNNRPDWNPRAPENRRPGDRDRRRFAALKLREQAARIAFERPHPEQKNNGDEQKYPNFIGNYSKGLPHNERGEVQPEAYKAFLKALQSGRPEDFEAIPLGDGRKLTNPQAGLAFDLEAPDAQAVTVPPAPSFDSAEAAAEMAELYWMALLRDVSFTEFDSNSMVASAAADLEKFSAYEGKDQNGRVTPATLFRGFAKGNLVGPYISQFLLKGNSDKGSPEGLGGDALDGFITYGTLKIDQRQRTVEPGVDYMTDFKTWLEVQRGVDKSGEDKFDPTRRFIRNLRDLANWVHFDALYEAYLNACLILVSEMKERGQQMPPVMRSSSKLLFPFDAGNPYVNSRTQIGFGTFGPPHILSLVTEVATRALKAVWFQKWFVHRRLRPEAFGGRVHVHKTGQAKYPINQELLNSLVLEKIFVRNKELNIQFNRHDDGTYLLPQAFPEGSPTHPAYGAGHATVAGACVAILKAWFDEDAPVPDPVVPNADGTKLEPYNGSDKDKLTVGGELNKIAANIAIGRNMGGVHWRTDYKESVKLGEAIAIGLLQEQSITYNEDLRGEASFTLTKFDGTKIKIEDGKVKPA